MENDPAAAAELFKTIGEPQKLLCLHRLFDVFLECSSYTVFNAVRFEPDFDFYQCCPSRTDPIPSSHALFAKGGAAEIKTGLNPTTKFWRRVNALIFALGQNATSRRPDCYRNLEGEVDASASQAEVVPRA